MCKHVRNSKDANGINSQFMDWRSKKPGGKIEMLTRYQVYKLFACIGKRNKDFKACYS